MLSSTPLRPVRRFSSSSAINVSYLKSAPNPSRRLSLSASSSIWDRLKPCATFNSTAFSSPSVRRNLLADINEAEAEFDEEDEDEEENHDSLSDSGQYDEYSDDSYSFLDEYFEDDHNQTEQYRSSVQVVLPTRQPEGRMGCICYGSSHLVHPHDDNNNVTAHEDNNFLGAFVGRVHQQAQRVIRHVWGDMFLN